MARYLWIVILWSATTVLLHPKSPLESSSGLHSKDASATFYGYIKLDASYDDARTDKGNYAFVVLDEPKDDEFNMTANQSRIGLKFDGPNSDNMKILGKVEFDFYGGGAENKSNPMMRHAYLELKCNVFNLLAGQTSDLFAPLNPTTLNYTVMWKCGNTGYRRPQLRLTKDIGIGANGKLTAGLSLNRSMGRGEDGEDSGIPTEEGRIAFSHKLFSQKFSVLGISGAWGQEESDVLEKKFDMKALAVDLFLPLGNKVAIKGEFFTGQNLAIFLGGIGQGIDTENEKEIEATGGWGQLSLFPKENIEINLGAGIDNPYLSKEDGTNNKEENLAYVGNVIWKLNPAVSIGLEYMRMETKYNGGDTFQNNRGQVSFIYHF